MADHGAGAPSCATARLAASGNRPSISSAVAAGILAIGDDHGGAGANTMQLIAEGLAAAEAGRTDAGAGGAAAVETAVREKRRLPGLGHRVHTTDPRVTALFDMARAEGVAGDGILFMEALEAEAADADQAAADEHRRRARRRSCTTWDSRRRRAGSCSSSPRRRPHRRSRGGIRARAADAHQGQGGLRRPAAGQRRTSHRRINGTEPSRRKKPTVVQELVGRARSRWRRSRDYDQATVDRICRAVGWAGGNEQTATRLANMSVDESGMGAANRPGAPRSRASCATRCGRRAWGSSKRIPRAASSSTRSPPASSRR